MASFLSEGNLPQLSTLNPQPHTINQVSSRLIMLVFLLVSSMSLLFLHWYMD